jgi:hypothetical protein
MRRPLNFLGFFGKWNILKKHRHRIVCFVFLFGISGKVAFLENHEYYSLWNSFWEFFLKLTFLNKVKIPQPLHIFGIPEKGGIFVKQVPAP